MIIRLAIPVLLMLMATLAHGQRFEAGLLAGFNGSQVEGDSFKGYHKPGVLAGLFVQTDIVPAVFAGMEIKYSQKGSRRRIRPRDPEPEVI